MSIAEKLQTIAENEQKVYEAGKQAVWAVIQKNGKPANYYYAFAYNRFDDESYNPIYPIVCSDGTTPSQSIFYANTKITDTKVEIIASNSVNACFYNMEKCHTIRKFTVASTTSFTNTFYNCENLVNIEFGGTIEKNISLAHSAKLSDESIQSIIDHLGTVNNLQTITFHTDVVAKLTNNQITQIANKNWQLG